MEDLDEKFRYLIFLLYILVHCVILLFFVYLVARKKKASDVLKEGILKEVGGNR